MHTIDLKKYPKIKLIDQPSAIYHLKKISTILEVDIYIKRDDLFDIGLGGNKLRKLEYLLGEAKKQKATHVFTVGAVQSNHARMTAITAKMQGFELELFLKKSVPMTNDTYFSNGNIILNNIVDAVIHDVLDNDSAYQAMNVRSQEIGNAGGKAYIIPIGGSNSLGTLGYVDCYFKIVKQQIELGVKFDYITTASGSGGTHAGLIVGNALSSSKTTVKAYNVEPDQGQLAAHTLKIANECLLLCADKSILTETDVHITNEYSGEAYGIPSDFHIDTIKFLAKYEGIFLDPVYTSKAFAGILNDIQNNVIKKGEKVLYIHTGGTAGIFAYEQYFKR